MKREGFGFLAVLVTLLLGAPHAAGQSEGACAGRLIDDESVLHGPLCVPEAPARIVVLDPTFTLGMGLELGLPIVAAPLTGMSDAALKAQAEDAGVADLGPIFEPSIERIVAEDPDLIIGSGLADMAYPLLSGLAPTVLISTGNWKPYLQVLANVTGRSDKAAELLERYEQRVAELRPRIPSTTVSVLRITSWDFQVFLDGPHAYGPFAVLHDLGVNRTEYETATGTESLKRPDWEGLAALEGDILLYIIGGANSSDTDGRYEEVLNNPLWKMLPAVEAGRVHRVDAATWMEFSGIASANRVLDDVERFIIDAR